MPLTPATPADIATVSKQLGRPARDIVAIAARCICGNPIVVQTKPRLGHGEPFPTTYYLTLPAATASISTLEAPQVMKQYEQMLADDALAAGPGVNPIGDLALEACSWRQSRCECIDYDAAKLETT